MSRARSRGAAEQARPPRSRRLLILTVVLLIGGMAVMPAAHAQTDPACQADVVAPEVRAAVSCETEDSADPVSTTQAATPVTTSDADQLAVLAVVLLALSGIAAIGSRHLLRRRVEA